MADSETDHQCSITMLTQAYTIYKFIMILITHKTNAHLFLNVFPILTFKESYSILVQTKAERIQKPAHSNIHNIKNMTKHL